MWKPIPKAMAVALVLLALGPGCATDQVVQHRESLLVEVGFRAHPAITPGQRWLVRNLPTDKVSTVVRKGQVYYVYPDPSHDVLYVGHESDYLNYMLKAAKQGYGTGEWDAEWGDWDAQ